MPVLRDTPQDRDDGHRVAGWGDTDRGLSHPGIRWPASGGAVRGIDDSFSASGTTGAGVVSLPLPFSTTRDGGVPPVSLGYSTGGSAGAFGFGWAVTVPVVRRLTSRGVPRYRDDGPEPDVFVLGDGVELVPRLVRQGERAMGTGAPGHAPTRDRGVHSAHAGRLGSDRALANTGHRPPALAADLQRQRHLGLRGGPRRMPGRPFGSGPQDLCLVPGARHRRPRQHHGLSLQARGFRRRLRASRDRARPRHDRRAVCQARAVRQPDAHGAGSRRAGRRGLHVSDRVRLRRA